MQDLASLFLHKQEDEGAGPTWALGSGSVCLEMGRLLELLGYRRRAAMLWRGQTHREEYELGSTEQCQLF